MARRRWRTRKRKALRRSVTVHLPLPTSHDHPLCGVLKYGEEVLAPKSTKAVDCVMCLRLDYQGLN